MRKNLARRRIVALALAACGRTDWVDDSERCLTAQEAEAKIGGVHRRRARIIMTPEQHLVAYSAG